MNNFTKRKCGVCDRTFRIGFSTCTHSGPCPFDNYEVEDREQMKDYCAESKEFIHGQVRMIDHTYPARNVAEAEEIALRNGWTFLGEMIMDEDVDDCVIALIEWSMSDEQVH